MSDTVTVRFAEYDTHLHPRAVSNAQEFYDHEIGDQNINNGTEVVWKKRGTGRPKKILKDNRLGSVYIKFIMWNLETVQKIQNLKAIADSEGRIVVFPVYDEDNELSRVVLVPDESIIDNLFRAGYHGFGDEIELEFPEAERPSPFNRQLLFRNVNGNNLLSTTDDDQLYVTQIDSGNMLIRLNRLPNMKSLFEPETGKEWALQQVDDLSAGTDPTRTGDYLYQLKVIKHSTYTNAYMYSTRWLKVENIGKGTLAANWAVNDKVCLYNPFVGFTVPQLNDPIVEKYGSGWRSTYVGPGGLFRHSDGDFVLLVNGNESGVGYTIGSFKGATLETLAVQNGDSPHVWYSGSTNWREDQIFASGNPIWLPDENKWFSVANGYSGTDSKWRIGWFKFDENFNDIEIASSEIIDSSGSSNGLIAGSVLFYKNKYWMIYTDRDDNANPNSATDGWSLKYATATSIAGPYTEVGTIASGNLINNGLWRSSHVDNACAFLWAGELYVVAGGTAWYKYSGTRGNRVYGLFKYDEATQAWDEYTGNPVAMQPQAGQYIWDSDYSWCYDHTGGYPCIYTDKLARKLYFISSYNSTADSYQIGYSEMDLKFI